MRANKILLQKKYARVIALYAEEEGITLEKAFELFFTSNLYELLQQGVSDIHCMSDAYLVEELKAEYKNKK